MPPPPSAIQVISIHDGNKGNWAVAAPPPPPFPTPPHHRGGEEEKASQDMQKRRGQAGGSTQPQKDKTDGKASGQAAEPPRGWLSLLVPRRGAGGRRGLGGVAELGEVAAEAVLHVLAHLRRDVLCRSGGAGGGYGVRSIRRWARIHSLLVACSHPSTLRGCCVGGGASKHINIQMHARTHAPGGRCGGTPST